jgi:tripartite ATP-independent transporter DctM subunit
MELYFLALLILLMAGALASGFPVAFSLPGAAILTIAAAALCGWVFAGDERAFFAHDGPIEWLTAGVTNFRGIYWEVERDTLIAIPLFVFMGIMLQRSKIAEDLLVKMAQLFGPIPGGLGISVVFVGALLAATTGIVGATVVAMGLISLPAMLRNNYSKPLATGTIAASGTLGQIIPPSIVLIILADQLASAADQASTTRKADFKAATGEFSMPTELDVISTSAGDMFLGAFLPGLVLVGLYMAYILVVALLRPKLAPAVHYDGKLDRKFALSVLLALVPPLALIFAVLGSILLGIATVNQAGAIGAAGATIMAGYRLMEGKKGAYYPAILAVVSVFAILVLLNIFNLNVKAIHTSQDAVGVGLAVIAVLGLLTSIIWSGWRAFKIDETLKGVMVDTATTTSMVFIILLGAAMLTAAFRAFGGEELVREFLTGLPGGFWAQFFVVMAVIFILGFFLDFIEIAVVVVPIVAPILLADPSANVTAVWLGVMIGLNIQTSFLTPPFGFALFYLRGVAPPSVKTLDMYKGVVAFISLQLIALVIVAFAPALVNYLPQRTYLTSETAPPPLNPRLQACMEEYLFEFYDEEGDRLKAAIQSVKQLDYSMMPEREAKALQDSFTKAEEAFTALSEVKAADEEIAAYEPEYRPLHVQVRGIQASIAKLDDRIKLLQQRATRYERDERFGEDDVAKVREEVEALKTEQADLKASIPENWEADHKKFLALSNADKRARNTYRRMVDQSYDALVEALAKMETVDALAAIRDQIKALPDAIVQQSAEEAQETVQAVESALNDVADANDVRSPLSKVRRALRDGKMDDANEQLVEALEAYDTMLSWRQAARDGVYDQLSSYEETIRESIGLRKQQRLPREIALDVAACQSVHKDISLDF